MKGLSENSIWKSRSLACNFFAEQLLKSLTKQFHFRRNATSFIDGTQFCFFFSSSFSLLWKLKYEVICYLPHSSAMQPKQVFVGRSSNWVHRMPMLLPPCEVLLLLVSVFPVAAHASLSLMIIRERGFSVRQEGCLSHIYQMKS